ncbi:hypothetical protein E3N88_01115 [Mikania micrantha]|uniref:Protein kinase domain-containing protein n=1 Tax=Mikania micrantha TaxID=192012 RepID=A0A5N6Q036_9ASTR|nr:hypothetical protein E3N88_01115 [Mikania micrantha]
MVKDRVIGGPSDDLKWEWKHFPWHPTIFHMISQCKQNIIPISLKVERDKWFWGDNHPMDFFVRVARELIEARLLPVDNYRILWSRWVPLKVNAFAWRAGLDRIQSKEGLNKRGILINPLCSFCSAHSESTVHLLLRCETASSVWDKVFMWCKAPRELILTIKDLLCMQDSWPFSIVHKKLLHAIFITSLWCIWKARNARSFDNSRLSTQKNERESNSNMLLDHFIIFMFIIPLTMAMGTFDGSTTNNNIAKPNCPTACGNITVPYPFGMGTDCSLDDISFNLTCNTSNHDSPKLFIGNGNLEIYNISDSEVRIFTIVSNRCYNQTGYRVGYTSYTNIGKRKAFTFSTKNKFTVVGCDDFALISGRDDAYFAGGCYGLCREEVDVADGECSGIGCCQASMPKGLTYYNVTLNTLREHSDVLSFNECGYGFLVEEGKYKFNKSDLSANYQDFKSRIKSTMPIVLDWVIKSNKSCDAEANVCKGNSSCYDVEGGGGYRCKCNHGYQGNPYLDQGCQDINECNDQETYPCHGVCINTVGSYNCTCKSGYFGDANVANGCQPKDSKFSMTILMTGTTIIGLFAVLSGIAVMCFGIRRRKLIRLREKFFEQNGGVLLKQKIESQGSNVAMTLYSTEQLRKATDNYSQEKIIGKVAYGVVYKGVLPDKSVVAIKRSKLVDATQAEQFINEVMILTQVIHRHVVKLLGCCLEEEVPVLVYEFISNNTLFHHIHSRPGGLSWLSWENRLRIATEAASALGFIGDDRPTMREVAMELEGLRKFTTHPWVQQHTCNNNDTKSLVLEVEQSDLYDVPLVYGTNELESSSSVAYMMLAENNPR